MGFARVKGDLTSRIGNWVKFGAPNDASAKGGEARVGKIIDEVWADEEVNKQAGDLHSRCAKDGRCWGDYAFFAQLIEWQADESRSIRLGYYRRRCGEDWWEFASQMTINTGPDVIRTLLTKTLAKADWFELH